MPRRQKEGIYERKDSPYWWASYTDGRGERVRKSTRVPVGEDGRQEAEALLAKWKLEAHQQRMWGKQEAESEPAPTFDEVMLAYIKGHKTRGSDKRRLEVLKQLYPFFSGKRMEEIGDLDVRDYVRVRSRSVSPGTINREVGVFSAACNYCRHELGWKIGNPAQGKRLKEPEGRVRWLSHDEAERLIEAARATRAPWLADFIQVCLYTGMRKSEVTGLTWDRVDLSRRLVLLESGTTKSGKRRTVPLHWAAAQAIQSRLDWRNERCPGSPWVFCNSKGNRVKDMRQGFASALRRAGIKDFRQHDQRHTLASWMVMSGTELMKVRDMLGHASVEQTQRYAHLHPDALREAVENLVPARNGHDVEMRPHMDSGSGGKQPRIH
ncbi:site-specific integrase [Halomonas sp.]|uniref:tyrosine-type recombinase/integrase n=1 Tax=Halomonas sp. TaxID=1486246 RepID=UPI000C8AE3F4|nr:site-specific integrase [Halomonas sp.]MAR70756.1 recombinase XerD [Halomonas sp.]